MHETDRLRLLAELVNESCELNHGPETSDLLVPAMDFIVLPIGFNEESKVDVCAREMVIPICFDCAHALLGEEWTLLYCFECCSSHWVNRAMAKNRYRHHILWLRGCPECSYEFGGLYFSDEVNGYLDNVNFLGNEIKTNVA